MPSEHVSDLQKFPGAVGVDGLMLGKRPTQNNLADIRQGRFVLPAAVNSAATIAAYFVALGAEPPVFTRVFPGDGTQWIHATAGTAAGNWSLVAESNLAALTATVAELNTLHSSGATNADLIKLHALTATAAEVNELALLTAAGNVVQSLNVNVTAAALAAANVVLLACPAGKAITVIDFTITPLSTISGTGITGVIMQDTAGTPLIVDTTTNLTSGVPTHPWTTTAHTLGAQFRQPLTTSANLVLGAMAQASKANFACTSGVQVTLSYQIV